MKVMIVDDDPDVGVQLQGDIEDAGHEVTDIASSFQLAVDLFERDSPDCVLVDIHLLDGQTGLAVGRYLADLGIPYGYISADLAAAERDTQALAVVRKPYTLNELASALDTLLLQITIFGLAPGIAKL